VICPFFNYKGTKKKGGVQKKSGMKSYHFFLISPLFA